jgi:hypothetical protein
MTFGSFTEPRVAFQFLSRIAMAGTVMLILGACQAVPGAAGSLEQTSEWGQIERGLRLRILMPKKAEQGVELTVRVEFQCQKSQLPQGIRQLNTFMMPEYLTLSLSRRDTKESFIIRPHDQTHGMLGIDDGKTMERLDGSMLNSWDVTFPLLAAKLATAIYDCRVELSVSGKSQFWRGTDSEWEAAGFWNGKVVSGALPIEILMETPKTQVFQIPIRLRLAKWNAVPNVPVVTYGREDTAEIKLPVRNGFYVGARTTSSSGWTVLGGSRPLAAPDDPNPVDQLHGYKGGGLHRTYTMEIFETSDPPGHRWSPENGDYKLLWKKEYTVDFTEREIRSAAKD